MLPRVSRRLVVVGVLLALVLWIGIPVARTVLLLRTASAAGPFATPRGMPVQSIEFHAADGVLLRGWFVPASLQAPSVILIAGFKADRRTMVPYARFLHAAGFNVLLYDSRGTGESGGSFSLGLHEVDDVLGAIAFLRVRPDIHTHRFALLGVSFGSGVAMVAAERSRLVTAVVADTPYVDEHRTVDRLDWLRAGPIAVPLAPLGPAIIEHVLGRSIDSFSPLRAAPHIAPRALFLIHTRHDPNATTPLSDTRELFAAARSPKRLWIAPRGGHAAALAGQPAAYRRRVISFLRTFTRPNTAQQVG